MRFLIVFSCSVLLFTSCEKVTGIDTMALLKKELEISIEDTRNFNIEILSELKQRAQD